MNQDKVFKYAMILDRFERDCRIKFLRVMEFMLRPIRRTIQRLCTHDSTRFSHNITREVRFEHCNICKKLVTTKEYE